MGLFLFGVMVGGFLGAMFMAIFQVRSEDKEEHDGTDRKER